MDEKPTRVWILVDNSKRIFSGTRVHTGADPAKDPEVRRKIREEFAEEVIAMLMSGGASDDAIRAIATKEG